MRRVGDAKHPIYSRVDTLSRDDVDDDAANDDGAGDDDTVNDDDGKCDSKGSDDVANSDSSYNGGDQGAAPELGGGAFPTNASTCQLKLIDCIASTAHSTSVRDESVNVRLVCSQGLTDHHALVATYRYALP
jgi:hypothetical protein